MIDISLVLSPSWHQPYSDAELAMKSELPTQSHVWVAFDFGILPLERLTGATFHSSSHLTIMII